MLTAVAWLLASPTLTASRACCDSGDLSQSGVRLSSSEGLVTLPAFSHCLELPTLAFRDQICGGVSIGALCKL